MNLDEAKKRIKELELENKRLKESAMAFSSYVLKTNEDIRLFVERIRKHAKSYYGEG